VLEAALVDRGEEAEPIAEARLLGHVDAHRLGQSLDLEHARHDRLAGEVALEEPLGGGHGLEADDPLGFLVVLDDPVDEQERPAMRDELLDLAGRQDGSFVAGSVTGRLLSGGGDGSAVAGGDERGAADSVEQVRRHLAIDEDLVGQDGPVQVDVGLLPSTSSSRSAASPRAIAWVLSGAQTQSLPRSES
jgi:hypothetical protein